MSQSRSHSCRQIPSADRILGWPEVLPLLSKSSRNFILTLLREILSSIRQELKDGIAEESDDSDLRESIIHELHAEFDRWTQPLLGLSLIHI